MLSKFAWLALAGILATAGPAEGSTLFAPGTLDSSDGNEMSAWIQANVFTLRETSRISGLAFYGLASSAYAYRGTVQWRFYSDQAGTPGTLLASGLEQAEAVDEGPALLDGLDVYRVQFTLSEGFVATGGTQYWLGLHNGPVGETEYTGFYLAFATTGGAGQESYLLGTGFTENGGPHYVELQGDVYTPEPGTWTLTAGSLTLLAAGLRRRRYRSN